MFCPLFSLPFVGTVLCSQFLVVFFLLLFRIFLVGLGFPSLFDSIHLIVLLISNGSLFNPTDI